MRAPYFADWNNIGNHNQQMRNQHWGRMYGYGFGWGNANVLNIEFDGSGLTCGIYFYTLKVGNYSLTKNLFN